MLQMHSPQLEWVMKRGLLAPERIARQRGELGRKMHVEDRKWMTGEVVLRELAVGGECTVLNLHAITI